MKKKTSIFLFKLWLYPPIVIVGGYFATGLSLSLFGREDELLRFMHDIRDNHGTAATFTYYCYVAMSFALMIFNAPFWGSMLLSGISGLGPDSFHAELVRNNRFLFWDEIIDRYAQFDQATTSDVTATAEP